MEVVMRGLKWLTGLGQSGRAEHTVRPSVQPSQAGDYRCVRPGQALLETVERQKLIRILRENCPLSQAACDEFWLKPLQQLAGRVQEVPAAWTGPFSSPGGFIDLSLSVAAGSVRLVRGMMLPPGATPEEQSEQGPAWVCAVFWAGLFHHLDWLSLVEGSLAGGKPWYPGMEMPGANWRVRPRQGGAGAMNGMYIASRLIPDAAAVWLQRWPAISGALFLYLSGQKAQSGILNSIISDALASVAFTAGAASVPVPSAVVPSALVRGLHGDEKTGENSLPDLIDDDMKQSSRNKDITPVPDPIEPVSAGYDANQTRTNIAAAGGVTEQVTLLSAFDNCDTETPEGTTEESDTNGSVSTADLLSVLDQMSGSPASGTTVPAETDPATKGDATAAQESRNPGEAFLNWLKSSVLDGTVSVNESDSFAHILAQFVFIVSPECFYKYLSLNTNESVDKSELQKSFETLDVHYSRNGKGLWHYHKYDTPDKSGRYTKMSGYMLSADIIYRKGTCPPDSVWLARRN
ncbi:helicase/relaxase domain-containing protein [Citrobacter koseri]|uniref:helicase/relaxase domain-containing protein n=2 Tax=Citrobacter koseri TaxID=545 RepID=UPI00222F17EF|nr:helicase/relaxase domain-containing protein [Citrobacter koseri]MDM9066998.1 helicase/relaxase domain-containing protein [Citrobacter koseri]MDM9090069.1 helicase/relaxase domain-containing protein [Citrobacter koseri]MDM9095475.1 helicase/relaxase domain-containing protein [Citrobacter koseri]MDM9274828.1 helicase/relaxase domain-containing protein [Citrobacter koseri]BDG91172.1 membrane protein [Citrobacter koseri]